MSGFSAIKTFDRYSDDSAPPIGTPAATGVWAMRITKFDAGAKIGFAEDNLRNIRALSHYRRKPGPGVEPFEVYISGNLAFEYVTSPPDFDIFDGSLSPQSSTDIGANQVVVGPDAAGAPTTGSPIRIAGTFGGAVKELAASNNGALAIYLQNTANGAFAIGTPGAAAPAAAVQLGLSDGTNLQRLAGDTKGRLLAGESNRPTYCAVTSPTLSTAGGSIIALEADATRTFRLRKLIISGAGSITTANEIVFKLLRSTAASSGGTPGTPQPVDPADPAFGGISRWAVTNGIITTTPTSPSPVEGHFAFGIWVPAALAPLGNGNPIEFDFDRLLGKPFLIPPGAANGLVVYQTTPAAGANALAMWWTFILTAE